MYLSSYWEDSLDSKERNVESKCRWTPQFLWGREVRGKEETALFLSLLLKQAVLLYSLSLKKFTPSNKVHRLTQKQLSSIMSIGCCWHMLKAIVKGNIFFISQNSTIKWVTAGVNKEFIPWGLWDLEDAGKIWWNLQFTKELSLNSDI